MGKEFEIYVFSAALNAFLLVDDDAFFQSLPLSLLAGKQYTTVYDTEQF